MTGLFAAVPTPVHDDGRVDEATFERVVELVVTAGVDGICVGGATSEYPHFETAERKALIRRAAACLPRDRGLLVGVGASSLQRAVELGEAALEAGSRAVLLPMPLFFRYDQADLRGFCAHVSRALRAPCLLYDLPEFTNGLAPETALGLLRDEEFIVGIKDSSGRPENLVTFASARGNRTWSLLVGDDRLLQRGLAAGWNGAISGVAGFYPELLVALYRSFRQETNGETSRLQTLVNELSAQLATFPAPWGIRVGLAARGLGTGPLPLPVTSARQQQIQQFTAWFQQWHGSSVRL
jgi:4-hydroxy-tetrahydrodipicolinate synthase